MLFPELYNMKINKVTFVGFRMDDRPNRAPIGSAPEHMFFDQ